MLSMCKSTNGRKRQAPKDDDTATADSVRVNVKRIHDQPDDDQTRNIIDDDDRPATSSAGLTVEEPATLTNLLRP